MPITRYMHSVIYYNRIGVHHSKFVDKLFERCEILTNKTSVCS
jgi:hypothetical protein